MTKFAFDKEENIVGKGENAGYQHFLLFLQSFTKACEIKLNLCGKALKQSLYNHGISCVQGF